MKTALALFTLGLTLVILGAELPLFSAPKAEAKGNNGYRYCYVLRSYPSRLVCR